MVALRAQQKSFPGVILAGGLSRRMGSDKAQQRLGGKTLLEHVVGRLAPQVSIVGINADRLPDETARHPLLPDLFPGKAGPLAGILTAMRYASTRQPGATHVATVTIDSPFIPHDLVSSLAASADMADVIVLATSAGEDHPVTALWPVSIADDLQAWLQDEHNRRVRGFQLRHAVTRVEFPMIQTTRGKLDPFFNINNRQDLAEAEEWLKVLPQ